VLFTSNKLPSVRISKKACMSTPWHRYQPAAISKASEPHTQVSLVRSTHLRRLPTPPRSPGSLPNLTQPPRTHRPAPTMPPNTEGVLDGNSEPPRFQIFQDKTNLPQSSLIGAHALPQVAPHDACNVSVHGSSVLKLDSQQNQSTAFEEAVAEVQNQQRDNIAVSYECDEHSALTSLPISRIADEEYLPTQKSKCSSAREAQMAQHKTAAAVAALLRISDSPPSGHCFDDDEHVSQQWTSAFTPQGHLKSVSTNYQLLHLSDPHHKSQFPQSGFVPVDQMPKKCDFESARSPDAEYLRMKPRPRPEIFTTPESNIKKMVPAHILTLKRIEFNEWDRAWGFRETLTREERRVLTIVRRREMARVAAREKRKKDRVLTKTRRLNPQGSVGNPGKATL